MTITQTCAWPECGRTFEAERADARYCSPTCRARASKERKRAEGEDDTAAPEPAAPPTPKAVPESGTGSAHGIHQDIIERFFNLEDRVDDLEFFGKEDQKKLAGLLDLPERVEAIAHGVPTEAAVKAWVTKAAQAEIRSLRERVHELERQMNGPEGVANASSWIERLENRVTTLEDPGGDKSVQLRVKQLEAALIGEIERSDIQSENITTLAKLIKRLGRLVEG